MISTNQKTRLLFSQLWDLYSSSCELERIFHQQFWNHNDEISSLYVKKNFSDYIYIPIHYSKDVNLLLKSFEKELNQNKEIILHKVIIPI